MRKIRVLHAVEDLKVGGLETILADIVLNLNKKLFNVDVIALAGKGKIGEELEKNGVFLRLLNVSNYHRLSSINKIVRAIKKGKYDIVHTHGYFASTSVRTAAFLARVPVILSHVHNTHLTYAPRHLRIEKALSYITDLIYCCSNAVREFVIKSEKIPEKKIRVLYNGTRSPTQTELIKIPQLPEFKKYSDKIIINVSRLVKQKGHKILIEAASKVVMKQPNTIFLVVGDGPLKGQLEKQINELNLTDNVFLLGERRDVWSLLNIADIFALPTSGWEGLGLSLVEAMAMGLPLVGSRLGGIPEVIENDLNGFLVPPNDSGQLANALIRLLDNKNLAQKMGESSKKIYQEKFSLEHMIKTVEEDYLTLIKGKR
jgi:glycosyltransferase involved in cell wall biosynthesis